MSKHDTTAAVHGIIANVDTGEVVSWPLNPTQLKEGITVNWAEHKAIGSAAPRLQYTSTDAVPVGVEFVVDERVLFEMNQLIRRTNNRKDLDGSDFRRFLYSLAVPSRRGGQPSRVLFVWPGVLAITAVMKSVAFSHEFFDENLRSLVFTASVQFSEVLDVPVMMDEMRDQGTLRSTVLHNDIYLPFSVR